MSRITSIYFVFPSSSSKQINDANHLFELFSELQNLQTTHKGGLETNFEQGLLPKTLFKKQKELEFPVVSFNTHDKQEKRWRVGDLNFGFNITEVAGTQQSKSLFPKQPNLPEFVSTETLLKKLSGILEELNHSGINFSPEFLKEKEYQSFKKEVAKRSNLYDYPTGEEWSFIIPSTENEFVNDIKDESINRNPKFEIVYSDYNIQPVIQIDIATKLNKQQIFDLFPDPYGVSYEGLEDYFRSIFINVDWGNVLLRFDLGFGRKGKDFGYWIIKDGGRII